jgi:hypothetical protein
MEIRNVSLRGIKGDPLAHELATAEATQPYLDCAIKTYCDDAVAFESALQVVRVLAARKAIYVEGVFGAEVGHLQISRTNT